MDDLFNFARDLTRAHAAALMSDSPTRVGAPEYVRPGPGFDQLPREQRLDAAERLVRRQFYKEALQEAFGEHPRSASFFALLLDSSAPDDVVGKLGREIALEYLARCAEAHGEDIREFV